MFAQVFFLWDFILKQEWAFKHTTYGDVPLNKDNTRVVKFKAKVEEHGAYFVS